VQVYSGIRLAETPEQTVADVIKTSAGRTIFSDTP
jgi:hypothetical protein